LKAAARRLQELGAEVAILGCTEIPLALQQSDVPDLPLDDPLDSLARALVDAYRSTPV
jgi:aspartate/glutamate racemase